MLSDMVREYLEIILPRAEANACCLYVRSGDGNIFEMIAGVGVSNKFINLCQYVRAGRGFIGSVAETGKFMISENIIEDTRFTRRATAAEGFKSCLGMPLSYNGLIIGVLYLLWKEKREFPDTYIRKVNIIAEEATEEVRMLHVLTETRRRARALEVLYRLGGDIYGLMDLKRIGEIVSEEIKSFLDIETFLIYLNGDYHKRCIICEGDWVGKEEIILSKTEAQTDPYKILSIEGINTKNANESCDYKIITIPITLGNQSLGRIIIGFCERLELEPWEIDFLQQMSRSIGMAVANYDMFISHQIRTTLLERSRLAQEFHDSLAQILASIILEVSTAKEVAGGERSDLVNEKLEKISIMLDGAYEEVRAIIQDLGVYDLRSVSVSSDGNPDDRNFLRTLKSYLSNFESRTGLEVYSKLPKNKIELPKDIEVQLWRIIQEALNNVWKHACATKVNISIMTENKILKVIVSDNGCGMTSNVPLFASDGQHFGLIIMRDRTESVGGKFTIESSSGTGTCIEASFPYNINN